MSATLADLSEEDAWRAVKNRDRTYDGEFVFGTLTTRIYCRPSCPSRRPRRDRVVFFSASALAKSAGFRACLRCKPDDDAAVNPGDGIVRRACAYLESHRENQVTLSELGKAINASPYYIQRTFKSALGISPREYSERLQLMNVRSLLGTANQYGGPPIPLVTTRPPGSTPKVRASSECGRGSTRMEEPAGQSSSL